MSLLICALALPGASGCAGIRYVSQAAWGHLDVVSRATPIEDWINQRSTPPKLRELLLEVRAIKAFGAQRELAFSNSYDHFAALDRSAVVWSVAASTPLSFQARTWSFPIIGSVPYLGWFDRDAAEAFARQVAAEGFDVAVRPVGAYSTLGWFDDPLLSTMLSYGPQASGSLANIILHEAVHATHYVDNQSTFNESLASFVADTMTPQYLSQRYGEDAVETRAYQWLERRFQRRLQLKGSAYQELRTLYASTKSREEKLAEKERIFTQLRKALPSTKPLNNATLIDFRTYRSGQSTFMALFSACEEDWGRFFSVVRTIGESSFRKEQQADLDPVIQPLIDAGCQPRSTSTVVAASRPGASIGIE